MANRLFILLLLCGACGKDVAVDNSKLESYSQVTEAEALKVAKEGSLKRNGEDPLLAELTFKGSVLKVSPGSSYLALTAIKALPPSGSTTIKFVGTVKDRDKLVVLEEITPQ